MKEIDLNKAIPTAPDSEPTPEAKASLPPWEAERWKDGKYLVTRRIAGERQIDSEGRFGVTALIYNKKDAEARAAELNTQEKENADEQ